MSRKPVPRYEGKEDDWIWDDVDSGRGKRMVKVYRRHSHKVAGHYVLPAGLKECDERMLMGAFCIRMDEASGGEMERLRRMLK